MKEGEYTWRKEGKSETVLPLVSQPHGKNAPVDTIQSLLLHSRCYQKLHRLGEIAETRCSRVDGVAPHRLSYIPAPV